MIFTLGKTDLYESLLGLFPDACKAGRSDSEEGGSVWQTREEAQAACSPDFTVYGVDADWDADTYTGDTGGRHLMRDAALVRLKL